MRPLAFVPQPRSVVICTGDWECHGPLLIALDAGEADVTSMRELIDRFTLRWGRGLGWDVGYLANDDDTPASLVCAIASELANSYELRTDRERIEITAGTLEALQWALVTVEQLLPAWILDDETDLDDAVVTIRAIRVSDAPAFRWRGVHLDVARHFFDVNAVARFVDLLARHKLNVLHLHLNDDQGWRLEMPRWPKLTSVGARRHSSPLGHESSGVDDEVAHEGFFRAEDIRALVTFARVRGVTIVPEIDMPGHVQAILAAYPQFATSPDPLSVAHRWGISEHVMNLEEETFAFADDVLAYVGELFPGPYIHIGGDECPTTEWAASARVRERMAELNVSSLDAVQSLFTNRFAAAVARSPLAETGPTHEEVRRAVAWDEVLDAGAPRDVIIMAWRHSKQATRAARLGHDVVMAPMQFTYFDWPQSESPLEPVALMTPPWPTALEKVYKFQVLPLDLEPELHSHVLGAQAQHWSEYIATVAHLDYMAFPRLCAFAEVVWGTAGTFDEFRGRLEEHLVRLSALGVNFRPLDIAPDGD